MLIALPHSTGEQVRGRVWDMGRCALGKGDIEVTLQDVSSEQRTLPGLNPAVCSTPAECSQVQKH